MVEVPSPPELALLIGDFKDHSPTSLFHALTLPDRIVQWWSERAEVELELNGRYLLRWPDPDWTIDGTVYEFEVGRRLVVALQGIPDHEVMRTVEFRMMRIENGTRLAIWHFGFDPNDGSARRRACEAWIHFGMRLDAFAPEID